MSNTRKRKFNGKEYSLHYEYGTMVEAKMIEKELKAEGYNVRIVIGGISNPRAIVYKYKNNKVVTPL